MKTNNDICHKISFWFILYYKEFAFNKRNSPNINIKIGANISNKFVIFCDLVDTLFKDTPKNEERNIINPIPKLIAILAKNTEKYVFNIKA